MDRVWVGMDRVGVWVIVISGVLIWGGGYFYCGEFVLFVWGG